MYYANYQFSATFSQPIRSIGTIELKLWGVQTVLDLLNQNYASIFMHFLPFSIHYGSLNIIWDLLISNLGTSDDKFGTLWSTSLLHLWTLDGMSWLVNLAGIWPLVNNFSSRPIQNFLAEIQPFSSWILGKGLKKKQSLCFDLPEPKTRQFFEQRCSI